MILSKPLQPSPAPPRTHVSYVVNSELAPVSSPELLASPPTTPPRSHKHSLSKPMAWLGNRYSSTSTHSAPHATYKPAQIFEPRIGNSLDQLIVYRSGPLGSGATIVRTPQEALFGSAHRSSRASEVGMKRQDVSSHNIEKNESGHPRPHSPPLPPLPGIPDTEGAERLSGTNLPNITLPDHISPPRSSGSPSPPSHLSSSGPALVAAHSRTSCLTLTPPVDNSLTPPQPPFEAILLSPIPGGTIDPSKLIVTLETCTTTYRILLRSLVSRPSHLSRHITSLLSPASETASIRSNTSDTSSAQHSNGASSIFHDHLSSSDSPPRSTGIHVFLDRLSAPYMHVLAYLRSLPGTPEYPETLPRAVQLGSTSPSRLESLLELRDEATYLGLAELEKLCCQEIQKAQHVSPPVHSAAGGASRGRTGSAQSFHTIVERCPSPQEAPTRPSELRVSKGNSGSRTPKPAVRESSSGSSLQENKDVLVRKRGRQRRGVKYEVGSPPPGWI